MLSMKVKVTFCGSGHSVAPPLLHLEEAAEGGGGGDLQLVHHLQLPLLRLGSDFLTHNFSLDFVNFSTLYSCNHQNHPLVFFKFSFYHCIQIQIPYQVDPKHPSLNFKSNYLVKNCGGAPSGLLSEVSL